MDDKITNRRILLAGMGVVAGSILARRTLAGSLEPPAGAPSPSGQTLDALALRSSRTLQGVANPCTPVESLSGNATATYAISQAGSYYLTQNLIGVNGKHGIAILSPNVDLDLCGFHILGPTSAPVSGSGVWCNTENVCVYDGTVRGWQRGFDFEGASRFILWDLVSFEASAQGVALGGNGECYDVDVHNAFNYGITCFNQGTLVHECGVWTAPFGFVGQPAGASTRNVFLSNIAVQCNVPYAIDGNSYGPLVALPPGDMSVVAGSNHPGANFSW